MATAGWAFWRFLVRDAPPFTPPRTIEEYFERHFEVARLSVLPVYLLAMVMSRGRWQSYGGSLGIPY